MTVSLSTSSQLVPRPWAKYIHYTKKYKCIYFVSKVVIKLNITKVLANKLLAMVIHTNAWRLT